MPIPDVNYLAFIDEAGDYGLENISPAMPVFATCALTMTTDEYTNLASPVWNKMKYRFFGNECVVIHGHKIRQRKGEFKILKDANVRRDFMETIGGCFGELPDNSLICAAIRKEQHRQQYADPDDPFALSLCFLLERLEMRWSGHLSPENKLLCVFEKRGPDEDAITRERFERICARENHRRRIFHFDIDFRFKSENVIGHQYADLAAYSLARYVETNDDQRLDWRAVEPKVRRSPFGQVAGWGLKVFP